MQQWLWLSWQGRAVASLPRGLRFKSSHRQKMLMNVFIVKF